MCVRAAYLRERGGREREERKRERQRETETDRQTDRDRDRKRERGVCRQDRGMPGVVK